MATDYLFLNGIPDDRRVLCLYSRRTQGPAYIPTGTASFLSEVAPVLPGCEVALLGPDFHVRLHPERLPRTLVNHIGDQDRCSAALRGAAALHKASGLPCFNPPANVQRATRDGVASLLAGIDGLQVPRTIRVTPRHPRELHAAAAAADLCYPLIARIAGDHGGLSMVKLDVPGDSEPLHAIPWGGREMYLTEFVDYADADGLHRKVRLAVVGDGLFARHRVRAPHWLLHAADRDHESLEEEAEFLDGFDARWRPRLEPVVHAVRQRLGLDYFGIDCSLRPDGTVLLFEANPCMQILRNTSPSPNIWDRPISRILDSLLRLLQNPARWVAPGGQS
ncbi:RimK family alpha-L-glutamate ligase [Lysobacter sp. N42]|uniref:ATP-grasp domain-containing protein n=1 Tax=Lysobacter sp. N42 TaxID=2545719 RepID=UPI0010537623|nr:hypothetical protein [Lysobacter sp. N42]TCZ86192.1 hypothetical protein EYQ95_18530 [Lysobacter sp. N42]